MTARPKLTLERTFAATPDEVWELWTTRDGMEAWMGPDGFKVEVRELDLRPGGVLVYDMTAVGADQVEFMAKAGMPLVNTQRVTYVEVEPPRRLVTATSPTSCLASRPMTSRRSWTCVPSKVGRT